MLKPFMSLLGVMALMFVTAPPNVALTKTWLRENVFSESHTRVARTPPAARFAVGTGVRGALCAVQSSTAW